MSASVEALAAVARIPSVQPLEIACLTSPPTAHRTIPHTYIDGTFACISACWAPQHAAYERASWASSLNCPISRQGLGLAVTT